MAVSMCRNPSIEKMWPICGIAFCRTKWPRRSEMSFYVARNGFDGRKCRFMSHEMALTIGNAVLCRTKRLRRSEMPFYVARNGFDDRKCRFMSHEMASTVGFAFYVARKTTSTTVYATSIHEKRPSPEGSPSRSAEAPSAAVERRLIPPNAFQSKNRALPLFTNKKR